MIICWSNSYFVSKPEQTLSLRWFLEFVLKDIWRGFHVNFVFFKQKQFINKKNVQIYKET